MPKQIADAVKVHVHHRTLAPYIAAQHCPVQIGGTAPCAELLPPPPPPTDLLSRQITRQPAV